MRHVEAPVVDRISTLVAQILAARGIDQDFSSEASLIDIGLTSIDIVNLMLSVEAEFDIMFPPAEITPQNFHSVSSIGAVVERLYTPWVGDHAPPLAGC